MYKSKTEKLRKLVLILYLSIFPLGQVPGLIVSTMFVHIHSIHITDFLAFLFILVTFTTRPKVWTSFIYSPAIKFIVILCFSFIFGILFFDIFYANSFLYLLRAITYVSFAYILWTEKTLNRTEVSYFVVTNALVVSVVGLFQYLVLPDTRFLKIFGFDDHYYRLISTFLDPAFTGILLVLSLLYMSFIWRPKHSLWKVLLLLVVCMALLLTYSRASYLSLLVGVLVYSLSQSKISLKYVFFMGMFSACIFLLPRSSGGEGVKLERIFSIVSKFENSEETATIALRSPLFGVGYNNMCQVKTVQNTMSGALYSHSCAGADNSFLFVLATTGFVGFLFICWGIVQFIKTNSSPELLAISSAFIFHSQFTNTLFYPWVFMLVVICALNSKTTAST